MIYIGLIGVVWFILSPALTINTTQIGAPIKEFVNGWNILTISGAAFALALAITFLLTSGWGLFLLGVIALLGLLTVSILHPYLFPLMTPLFALWLACALARRRENLNRASAQASME